MLIAITGTPGTGKSEVTDQLGKLLNAVVIHLNQLAKEKKLYCGYDRKRKCDIVDIGKLQKEVEKITEKRKEEKKKPHLIIESHFAHDIPADLIVVLRCEIKELHKRLEKRGWEKAKIDENVEAEIMEVCLEEARGTGKPVVEIDTAGKTAGAAAKEVEEKIKKAKK